MENKYWILVDEPRFKWFPWLLRRTRVWSQECNYAQACELFLRVVKASTRRQVVILGAGREGGIQLLHEHRYEQSSA